VTQVIDYFSDAPLGQLVYDRTYSRKQHTEECEQIDCSCPKERWPDTVRRVVDGNLAFVDPKFIEPGERDDLYNLLLNRQLIPAGRHLWVTGVPGRSFTQNCHVAGFETGYAEHCGFVFSELMKGGGVGANYSSRYLSALTPLSSVAVRFICSWEHADFDSLLPLLGGNELFDPQNELEITIADSREGWVESLETVIKVSSSRVPTTIIFDLSEIRAKGSPIRGFGGVSSGPLPLAILLSQVANITNTNYGSPVTVTPEIAMQIDHCIAGAVIAGNVRRSARMSIMHWNDPAIEWFLQCKVDHSNHWSTNISVEIDNEFFHELPDEKSWASFVYEKVIEGMLRDGEPGFYNSSLASEGENTHIGATNPCISPETWTLTSDGPRKVGELVGSICELAVDGEFIKTQSDGFFQTGVKDTLEISFKNWKTPLVCTPNQKLHTPNGWVEASTLIPGSKLRLQDHQGLTWNGSGTADEGYLLGHLVGDGTFKHQKNGSFLARLEVWDKDGDTSLIRSEIDRIMIPAKTRSDFKGWMPVKGGSGWRMATSYLTKLAEEYGITHGNKIVTEDVERASSDFNIGFLRGLFDTDGHVEKSKASVSIRLSSSDPDSLTAVQRMLGRLGILSRIHLSRKASYRSLPDGKDGYKDYWCKDSYRLIIHSVFAHRFMERIGFWALDKTEKFYELTEGIKVQHRQMWAEVESINVGDIIPVFDCTLPGLIFEGNGLDIFDCGEMPLESWESCNLGHVNLAFGTDEDHKRSFRLMSRFLVRSSFCDIQDPKQQEVVARNRRIGVGFFGLQEWLGARGIKYSKYYSNGILADALTEWYNIVRAEADSYADELGINRPIKCTTLAPTGTIAKLAGTAESIQCIYAKYYLRRVRYADNDPEVAKLLLLGINIEKDLMTANTVVATFPCEDTILSKVDEEFVEEQHDIPIEKLLGLQVLVQRYYADNAISLTLNVPKYTDEDSFIEIKNTLSEVLRKNLPHVKGTTVFPEASRPQSPIERITKEQYDQMTKANMNAGESEQMIEDCVGGSCPIR
jgi:ribonucleotide reductase alpha subunit